MSVIGRFKPSRAGGWEGDVRTLTLDVRMRMAPNNDRSKSGAPDYRVLVGWTHVGDAWAALTKEAPPRPFLRVFVDDPMFPAPINMALFFDGDGQTAELHWRRAKPRRPIIRRSVQRPIEQQRQANAGPL